MKLPAITSRFEFKKQELFVLIAVSAISFIANLPEGITGNLVNRKLLLGTLVAVVVVAMFRYLQVLLLAIISILAVGANLPHELAHNLGVSQVALIICLAVLVVITVANRVFNLLPTSVEPLEIPDDEEALEEASGPREQMLRAIAHGDISALRRLIAMDTPINFMLNGTTPLHLATEKGYSRIVQLLIDHGANLLALNSKDMTPLDVALAIKKYAKTTEILYSATIPLLSTQEAH